MEPLTVAMPPKPFNPVPRSKCISTVSALSSAVWAVASLPPSALTEKFLCGRGAVRVHGGGFAGTIQAFVPNDLLSKYKEMIEKVFGVGNCYVLNIRSVGGYSLKK